MDAAVLDGELSDQLESAVREPVDGLLGYSFLKHFRVALDYPRRVLWLDPDHGDVPDRPGEYCQPGMQLENVRSSVRVAAVAAGSPAARAGIRAGDEVVSVDGVPALGSDVVSVGRKLEGSPGSAVILRLRRGSREWSKRVARTPLL
jgi:membrane-associated protease RseP (regulator of RpoE activity)